MKPKHFILTFLTLLVSITVSAYTFTVDGIYYKILSETDKTVAVVNKMRYSSYSTSCYEGHVIIPSKVTYAGISYDVTEIGGWAFYICHLTAVTIPNSITSIGKDAFHGCSSLTSIEIPSSVSEIKDYTFSGCTNLTTISIPNSITTIGKAAFNGCSNLTFVSIPNSVTEIGDYAFAGCGFQSFTSPSSVKSIGDYAFQNCNRLSSVTLSNGLKRIGKYAFAYLSYLRSVSLPSSIEFIDNDAFYNCQNLSTVDFSSIAPQYVGWHILTGTSWYNNQPNGLIYLGDALLRYKGTMPDNTSLSIREGTTCIAGSAFVSLKGLKTITIPSSVKSIGPAAFSNCTSLESVTIPENIEEVGNKAFCNTPWFTCQPDGLLYIGKVAYRYKGEMPANTSIEIREGTTAIVDSAFYNCTNLTDVIIPNSVAKIGPLAFSGCSSLTNVAIPGIPTIDEKTFENCTSLSEFTLQEGTSIINDYAFSGCSSLVTMHWPSTLKTIKNYVFNNCTSLTSMVFSEGLTSFGDYNFSGCTSITSVSFPSTLGDGFSGGSTFSGVSSIREARFHSRIVPQDVSAILNNTNIGENFVISKFIYYVPHGLREEYDRHISWNDKILEMGEDEEIVQFTDEEVKRICIANYDANLSGTVDKTELGEVHYPMIGSMSYFYKQNFSENTIITSFDEFKYFTNCTTVPSRFFQSCSNLSSITLPISVNYIEYDAFSGCNNLTTLKVMNPIPATFIYNNNGTPTPIDGSSHTLKLNQENCILFVPEGSKAEYEAADYWKDFSVITETYNDVSQEFQALVLLSANMQLELNHAVEGKSAGQYPDGSKAEFQAVIDAVNAEINKNISQEEIASLTQQLNEAKATFEAKVYQLGIGSTFFFQPEGSSSNLKWEITNRDPNWVGVTCNQYNSSDYSGDIIIPETIVYNGVTYEVVRILENAFNGCSGLSSITIGDNVSSIGYEAFSGCSGLTSIIIPNSITTIGYRAFWGCSGLTSVRVDIPTPLTIAESTFSYKGQITLIVPNGSKAAYEAADYWKDFKRIVEIGSIDATGITLSQSTLSFNAANQTATLTATVTPEDATIKSVTWTSSNTAVATVNENGMVTAIADGTATITATTADGTNLSASCEVTVAIPIPATGIMLNQSTLSFNTANQTSTLTATVLPSNATNKSVTWTSSNTSVATVSNTGVVTAKTNGTATITARTNDGTNLTATCTVTVNIPIPATGITLNRSTLSFNAANQTSTLTATVTPDNATYKSVTWTSSNTAVATVDENGVVTAVANGTATITATTADGTNLSATCIVTVAIPVIINFADGNVKALCVANWDTNGDGELSEAEAAAVTNLGTVFKNNNAITSFNELQYFTGLQSIAANAFNKCTNLTTVVIPNNITDIGECAFDDCYALSSINLPSTITFIGGAAFSDCRSLTSITLPEGIPSIGNWFFDNCTGLTEIVIPNSVSSIGHDAFYGCTGLTSVTIPNSVTSIGEAAFQSCSGLTSINIPENVTSISDNTFRVCTSLETVKLPSGITSIGNWAFAGCTSLSDATLPDGVISLGSWSFQNCVQLTSFNLPSSITSIGSGAFYGCSGLTSIIIPSSVASIDEYAFSNCGSLIEVKVDIATPLTITSSNFSNRANATLIVPVGSKAAYEAADYWKEFKRIIEFIEGDVNGDGEMDVVDVVDIARYVVGTPAETFVRILADINNNGEVNLGDAVSLVNMIAGDQNFVKAQRAPQRASEGNEALTLEGADGILSLALQNTREYTAFQFDLYVPEATDVTSMLLNAQRKQRHQLLYNKVEDGHWRVAAISTSNRTFNGYEGELLRIAIEGIANDDISIRNIRFFDTQSNEYAFDDICLSGTTTNLEGLTPSSKAEESVYDLQGRKVTNRQLTRGIYIVNGKKVVRK